MTFTLNMIFFAQVNLGRNDISANISDAPVLDEIAPILTEEVARRNELKIRRRKQRNRGIQKTVLYNSTRYQHHGGLYSLDDESLQEEPRGIRKRTKYTSYEQQSSGDDKGMQTTSSQYHPKVACFHRNGCDGLLSEGIDLLLLRITRFREDSIPRIRTRRSKTQPDSYDNDNDDDDTRTKTNIETTSCRESRSIESRTTIHPTCNDVHSIGFDDQMFDKDYSPRGESIDLLAVGGANSVWKTTSTYNGEDAILKTAKFMKAFDKDRLDLYVLDAMVSAAEGNPQLFSLLQSKAAVAQAYSSSSTSSSWNHIMPIYSHCYTATIAPVASGGTLTEYVETYPQQHNGQVIHPMDKLRLALQVARGLYQMQMYRYGKPTFAHMDLNPSQFLVFHPSSNGQQQQQQDDDSDNDMPILQINDFNRGRFLQWDNHNNTCPFILEGCQKNTRGGRYHAPDRFIGCMDVNERIDTFTLGGVFFFLLSDGEAPFYNTRDFSTHIKKGELPWLPKEAAKASGDHPAFEALSEMVFRCRAFRIEDRPSSLEVVRMLEDKLRKIEVELG